MTHTGLSRDGSEGRSEAGDIMQAAVLVWICTGCIAIALDVNPSISRPMGSFPPNSLHRSQTGWKLERVRREKAL